MLPTSRLLGLTRVADVDVSARRRCARFTFGHDATGDPSAAAAHTRHAQSPPSIRHSIEPHVGHTCRPSLHSAPAYRLDDSGHPRP